MTNKWVFIARESTLYLLALSTTAIALVSLYLLFVPGWATWMAMFFFLLGGSFRQFIAVNLSNLKDEQTPVISHPINVATIAYPSPCSNSNYVLSRHSIDGDDFSNELLPSNSGYLSYFKVDKEQKVSQLEWNTEQNAAVFETYLEALAVLGWCHQHDKNFAFVIEETFKNTKQLQ